MTIKTDFQVIPVIGEVQLQSGTLPPKPSTNTLRLLVEPFLEGRRLERVRVFWWGIYTDMFVGEMSAEQAIRNVRATEIYHNNVRVHDPARYDPATAPPVCGPAVLFARPVWF